MSKVRNILDGFSPSSLAGIPAYVDANATESRWHFPADRFIEYGPEDEWWARKLGFGYATYHPAAYVLTDERGRQKLIIHPTLFAMVKGVK